MIGETRYAPQIIACAVALIGVAALPIMIFRDNSEKIEAIGEGVTIFSGVLLKTVLVVLAIALIGYLFGAGFSASVPC